MKTFPTFLNFPCVCWGRFLCILLHKGAERKIVTIGFLYERRLTTRECFLEGKELSEDNEGKIAGNRVEKKFDAKNSKLFGLSSG